MKVVCSSETLVATISLQHGVINQKITVSSYFFISLEHGQVMGSVIYTAKHECLNVVLGRLE
jgi:hypothetical protein